jgi:hypothetical protein
MMNKNRHLTINDRKRGTLLSDRKNIGIEAFRLEKAVV